MIERKTITDQAREFYILRFVNRRDPDYQPGETHYARSLGEPPKREWDTTRRRGRAHEFKDVAWARRFSKICDALKVYANCPMWDTEVIKVTKVRRSYDDYETAWPQDAITMLGQIDV